MANRKRTTNRKKKQNKGFVFPVPLAAILALVAVTCLSYLWLCGRTEALGSEIKRLENKKAAMQRQVANEEYKWSIAITPQNIQKALERWNLDMSWPTENQVVHVRNMEWYLNEKPQIATTQLAQGTRNTYTP